jgi:hypothetical protein
VVIQQDYFYYAFYAIIAHNSISAFPGHVCLLHISGIAFTCRREWQ